MNILVTGAAGFIGAALTRLLLDRGDQVVGVDDLNDYYDVNLKKVRLEGLTSSTGFLFQKLDISDRDHISDLFSSSDFDVVVNLAAQAGVRYSIENPSAYVDTNLVGFGNILEGCRHQGIDHLVYASSSSVYGSNTKLPFSENDNVDHPISLYAATKKANELMAHAYSNLYALPMTGLRFFTVYGPWGRPDMALFKFTKGILDGEPIPVYNRGEMIRDFTYIDDIVEGVIRAIDRPPPLDSDHEKKNDTAVGTAPYQIYNIGNGHPVPLMRYIQALEKALGKKAQLELLPMQVKGKLDGAVASSEASAARLTAMGIPVLDLNRTGDLSLYVDGADEATRNLHLIKGGGGALTREKIVASASRKFVCIVDESKLSDVLGSFPLPVEVIPMAQSLVSRKLIGMGGLPELRPDFTTDNGNVILDVRNLDLTDPMTVETALNAIAGVVDNGVFALQRADVLLVGQGSGVDQITV